MKGAVLGVAAGSDVLLATFDGAQSTSYTWREMNDPVMGGKSTGTFAVQNNLGIFDGEVVNVPFLKAPGFIKSATQDLPSSNWPDVSACSGLKINVKSDTEYKGYRFSIGNAHASGGKYHAYGYKQHFTAPVGEFGDVTLPFQEFTDYWNDATGEPIKTCAEDQQYCPTKEALENLETISVWAEGVNGKIHLEIKSVSATGCPEKKVVETVDVPAAATCPPADFESIENFNLDIFVSKPWYIQEQQETKYLPKNQNFCVSAQYAKRTKPTFWGYDIDVHNHAAEAGGTIHDSGDKLSAKVVDASRGKLEVAPHFLPTIFSGDYWVIDYDEVKGYALISGGPPKEEGANGKCKNGSGVNGSGLWIFTREQVGKTDLINEVRDIAVSKGFDVSVLNKVDQTHCKHLKAASEADPMITLV